MSGNIDTAEGRSKGKPIPYGSVIANAGIGIAIVDINGELLEANPAFCNMIGYSQEEIVGTAPPYVFRLRGGRMDLDAAPNGFPGRCEIDEVLRRKNGSLVPVHIIVSPLRDDDDKLWGSVCFFIDTTERMASEAALTGHVELLRAIFDCAEDAIFTKNNDGVYTSANRSWCKMLGLAEKEVVGCSDFDLLDAESAKRSGETDKKVLEGQTVNAYHNRTLGNKEYTFHVALVPLRDYAGGIIGLCGILRDVTEQRRIEESYLYARRLETLMKLAADIAHDFNNIIYGITGFTTLALSNVVEEHPVRADLEEILKVTEQAGIFTKKLLSMGRMVPLRLKRESMADIIHELANLLRRTFPADINIEVSDTDCACEVPLDRGQIERTLLDICVNARDAMPEGGTLSLGFGTVEISKENAGSYGGMRPGTYCNIVVKDNGEGMTPGAKERAFEPFFTTRAAGDGAGLGLSTVYGVVKDHGGLVRLESEEGKGTLVEVLLPIEVQGEPGFQGGQGVGSQFG